MFDFPLNLCSNGRAFWGWFFLVIGSFSFVGLAYAAVISNLFLPSLQNDRRLCRYYCLLVPLTLPVVIVAVYFHWLGMTLFNHASSFSNLK